MTNTAIALKRFFSGFGIPAYVSDNIPDDVKMPYITYDLIEPEPMATGLLNANVWYRDTSTDAISAKVDEIKAAIGWGMSIPIDNGAVYLFRDRNSRFSQIMNDPNRETKRAYLTMVIQCNTN